MRPLPVLTVAAVCLVGAASTPAAAQPGAVGQLAAAQAHLEAGEYAQAAQLAGTLARDPSLGKPDRAEAWRVYGMALFFMGLREEAEAALFEYLKLEPDAHLDPALTPPEAVVFFEEVRSRHAGDLARLRPRPRRTRYAALNLLPPAGQFQNRERVKGWALGITEGLLLATSITTYVLLDDLCSPTDCGDDVGTARTLQTVNLVSGGLLVVAVGYGIIDGFLVYRRQGQEGRYATGVVAAPTDGGWMVGANVVW